SDSVLTFDPHPVSVVAPQHTPKLLTTLERKAELIASLGVQELIVIPFDADERFTTVVYPLLEVGGEIVSSSHIRGLLLAGEVAEANELLGAPFQLSGVVAHGDARGRELGFPTANLIPDPHKLLPADGIYAAFVHVQAAGSLSDVGNHADHI